VQVLNSGKISPRSQHTHINKVMYQTTTENTTKSLLYIKVLKNYMN